MIDFNYIVIRRECRDNENRVALIPSDCLKLTTNYIVYVEKSKYRCFSDEEYMINGCILIDNYLELSHDINTILVIGLKELPEEINHYKYKHLYFSHMYKNQSNANIILNKFKYMKGSIYDLEYFYSNDSNSRLFAFGYYAGIAGCYMGLLQYYLKLSGNSIGTSNILINNNMHNNNMHNMHNTINILASEYSYMEPKIAIIGNGRCASGCIDILNQLNNNYSYTIFDRKSNMSNLKNYNIIFNCILLNPSDNLEPFITMDTLKSIHNIVIIVDISCDYNNKYNPIAIYNTPTTFINPILTVEDVDIIAIDNLPSLLPKESSIYFSNKLVPYIEDILGNIDVWVNVYKLFKNEIL